MIRRKKQQSGQALLLVIAAMGIFLIGALGLAIDGAQMYAHRQMAQTAADAAAQAAMMSIYDGTNGAGTHAFSTGSTFTCSTTDAKTPCIYAASNGFGASAADTVTVDFPTTGAGVNLSSSDPVNLVHVTVQRTLNTGLIRFLGPATSIVKAAATAAIVDVISPTPIIVTHPTLSGAFSANGNPTIVICGGPIRSVQVNSTSTTAVSTNSNTTVDLRQAGPIGSPSCTGGTGGDFGVTGAPATPPFTFLPGTLPGKYIQPDSPILDPLAQVAAPAKPGVEHTAPTPLANGVSGCPAAPAKACNLYTPGLYTGGINVKNETAVFQPGVYYMYGGGFGNDANGNMVMATGFPSDADTGQGMLVYDSGPGTPPVTGGFNVGANSDATLLGSCDTSTCNTYKGILFFEDHTAAAQTHSLGGNGCLGLTGTIYVTNTLPLMSAGGGTQYQTLNLQGTPCSGTSITGEVITSAIHLGGNSTLTMALNPNATLHIRQVALVK